MIWIAVAFYSKPFPIAFNHQINSISPYLPLWCYLVAASLKVFHDFALERRPNFLFCFLRCEHEMVWIVCVFNQLPAQITIFKIPFWIQRVDNPHLIASPAGGHIEALLEDLLITQAQWTALGSVHHFYHTNLPPLSLNFLPLPP